MAFNSSFAESIVFSKVGSCIFDLSAKVWTASIKLIPSIFVRNVNTFPPTPQPKQWNICLSGETENEGDFSLWNGQSFFRFFLGGHIVI